MPNNASWFRKKLEGSGSFGPGNGIGGGAGRGVAACDFVVFRFPMALEEGRDVEKGTDEATRGDCVRCACKVFCTSTACEGGSRVLKPPNGKASRSAGSSEHDIWEPGSAMAPTFCVMPVPLSWAA